MILALHVPCVLVLSTMFILIVFQVEAGWRRKLDIASWDGT